MTSDEVVYYRVDMNKTSVEAYNEFLYDVHREFEGEVSVGPPKRRELAEPDPNLTAELAKSGFFVLNSVAANLIAGWIKKQFEDDESTDNSDGNEVIQTGEGSVYIEELTVMPHDEATELFEEDSEES